MVPLTLFTQRKLISRNVRFVKKPPNQIGKTLYNSTSQFYKIPPGVRKIIKLA